MSSMRPPILAGPIDRNWKTASNGFSDSLIARSRSPVARPCEATIDARNGTEMRGIESRRRRREYVCIRGGLYHPRENDVNWLEAGIRLERPIDGAWCRHRHSGGEC